MEKQYDIIVIGAGTAGSYFAKRMGEKGLKVLVIERAEKDILGRRLSVFHMDQVMFEKFGVPEPKEGDPDYLNLFKVGCSLSAKNNYLKEARYPFVVLRLAEFTQRMIALAEAAGAEYSFETAFDDFTYDKNGKINGVTVTKDGKKSNIGARLVADCSGINAEGRTKLPDGYGVENFKLTEKDKFYVILRHVKLLEPTNLTHPTEDIPVTSLGWPYYKTWIAPAPEEGEYILGVGANKSFEYAEKCFKRFEDNIPLPKYEVVSKETGNSPYRREPYSFVADGFIVFGDASCIVKPFSGEGVTASWKLIDIASKYIPNILNGGKPASQENLWPINVEYTRGQGADFANMRAALSGAIDCSIEENDYEFKHDVVFSTDSMTRMNSTFTNKMPAGETFKLVLKIMVGVLVGKIKASTVKEVLKYSRLGAKLEKLYRVFPEDPKDFPEWTKKVGALWEKVGSMADKCVI